MEKTFEALKVEASLCNILRDNGIKEATPVQEAAIPAVRSGSDVVVQAQTGTGKTLAFLLPIMEKIKVNVPVVQALIVVPTRELAQQIANVAQKIGRARDIRSLSVFGGQALDRQIQKLDRHPHIIIGTPGRILDHLRRGTLTLSTANKVVLDEADQMLHMGFLDDVEHLIKETAADRQLMLFSATIPDKVRALACRYMHQIQDIRVDPEQITLEEIEQIMVDTAEGTKLDQLCKMINECQPYLAMVFCHTKQRAKQLTADLVQRGYLVDELHGDLSQAKRTQVMRKFSTAKLQILVATDIAARGLDIEGVTHVFNYDIPHDVESYIHRIGRTGRAGETGKAITFVNARQYEYLHLIERGIKNRIKKQKTEIKDKAKVKKEGTAKVELGAKNAQTKPKPPSLSKYANRKGSSHGGANSRSRRQNPSAANKKSVSRGKKR